MYVWLYRTHGARYTTLFERCRWALWRLWDSYMARRAIALGRVAGLAATGIPFQLDALRRRFESRHREAQGTEEDCRRRRTLDATRTSHAADDNQLAAIAEYGDNFWDVPVEADIPDGVRSSSRHR